MSRLKNQIKESDELVKLSELTAKGKKEYHLEQINSFNKILYRLWSDVQVAKKMIKKGEDIGEEAYVTQGENNIQEAVSNMRGVAIQLEKQRELLSKVED